ncbi:unnamed protein product [Cylicocyclus nassatus]|uniref:Uncharacterized protein n=1 Tax=Cylicocyclus nassatus TaxID=53992 RepID=A0AA36HGE2_CYLNA|nr:unnamed protein product [Cylicocyclus nassatus]
MNEVITIQKIFFQDIYNVWLAIMHHIPPVPLRLTLKIKTLTIFVINLSRNLRFILLSREATQWLISPSHGFRNGQLGTLIEV